jgi:hypothetical protein
MSMAASPEYPPEPLTPRRIAARWFAAIGPAAAAFGQQQLSYALVEEACARHAPALVHLPVILGLAFTGIAAELARREWARNGGRLEAGNGPGGMGAFFGVVGLMMSALAAGLILAQWLPTLFLDPCRR